MNGQSTRPSVLETPALYRLALDCAGYGHDEATAENVRNCFVDYVDCGFWRDIDMDDVDDISIEEMCIALIGR